MRGDWRKLHNEELHCVCCSSNNSSVINHVRWDGWGM